MYGIFLRFPGGLGKAVTLSYDDCVQEDARLIEIMEKHGLKGTFNISTAQYVDRGFQYPSEKKWGYRMTEAEATALYGRPGIEPALHALTHASLELLPADRVTYEILKNREDLERQFGGIVRGMAYPYGAYSDEVVQVLRDCGIVYARTTKETAKFHVPTDWLRWHPTAHHADSRLPELTKCFLERQLQNGASPLLFYLWGHAYEFTKDNNWHVIEQFAETIGNREDIWYATNMGIYEYVRDYQRLIFSVDGSYVQNPTAQTVWFSDYDRIYCVEPGACLSLK